MKKDPGGCPITDETLIAPQQLMQIFANLAFSYRKSLLLAL